MKRAYPSGAEKRRKSNTERLPKLTTFFLPKYQNETSEEEEEPAMTPTEQAAPASVTTVSGSGEKYPVSETQPPRRFTAECYYTKNEKRGENTEKLVSLFSQ